MRAAIVIVAVAGLLAPALATSSFAQTQRLPRRSPAEQQVDEINRSLTRKQQRVGANSRTRSKRTSFGRRSTGRTPSRP